MGQLGADDRPTGTRATANIDLQKQDATHRSISNKDRGYRSRVRGAATALPQPAQRRLRSEFGETAACRPRAGTLRAGAGGARFSRAAGVVSAGLVLLRD